MFEGSYLMRACAGNKHGPICMVVAFRGLFNLFSTLIDLRSLLRASECCRPYSYIYVEFFNVDVDKAQQYELIYESRIEMYPE